MIINVRIGDKLYELLVGAIRADQQLRQQMWDDAEHVLTEHPDKIWTIHAARQVRRWAPMAWCASQPIDGVLHCTDGYERHGLARRQEMYRSVHKHRHDTVLMQLRLPAVTQLRWAPPGVRS